MSVWSYEGKRVAIVGCYSGMGEATARELVRLGAEVHGADIRESPVALASFRRVDLREPSSIDDALKSIGGRIDALFNCAGMPQTFPAMDVMKANFIGLRYWVERATEMMPAGSAIASISSTAGFRHMARLDTTMEFATTPDFASAVQWVEAHPDVVQNGYGFSKEALIVWTMLQGSHLIKRGIRINCISPGPTQTPMMPEFEKASSAGHIDVFTQPIGRRATPEEMAYPIVFLNSDAATYINGTNLNVDAGCVGGITTGQIDLAASLARVAEMNAVAGSA